MPYKTCTYSCVYCQLGRTNNLTVERKCFYDWREVAGEIVGFLTGNRDSVDYVTFVPNGEPTLDACMGRTIESVKRETDARVAVLTNASLLWAEEVRGDLELADVVSVKVDAVEEGVWRRVNRPHLSLRRDRILEGLREFARGFKRMLISETMLVHGLNTSSDDYREIALFLRELNPSKAYISIPIRPPTEPFVKPPTERDLIEAYEEFKRVLGAGRVELLNMPEPPPRIIGGDPATWLLNTTAVHPLRYEHALKALEGRVGDPAGLIEGLIRENLLSKTEYEGAVYLLRNFRIKQ
uniref:Radical SAM protein n=1 Tax=Thermogladius calderae TaxID=1200300 RepID=A0A7J3XXY2_9CREN